MFYSKSTGGFYPESSRVTYETNGNWPNDAVKISDELYAEVVTNRPANKIVVTDAFGLPALSDPAEPTEEQLAASVRAKRDAMMAEFQWRIERYNSEARLGLTLTDSIDVLDAYMQALRDVTRQSEFPRSVVWPVAP